MSIDELNLFLDELFGIKENLLIRNTRILNIVKTLDSSGVFWHVEGDMLWKAKSWAISLEYAEKRRAIHAAEQLIVDANKDALEKFKEGLKETLGITDDLILTAMAIEFKNKQGGEKIAAAVGVDITNVPKLDKAYLVCKDGKYFNIGGKKVGE